MGVGIFLNGGSIFEKVRYVCVCVIASRFTAIYGNPKVSITSLVGQIVVVKNVWSHSHFKIGCGPNGNLSCPPDHHIRIGRFKFMENSLILIKL